MGQRRPVRGQELETAAELENIAETTERLPLGHVGFEPAARRRPPRWVGLGPSPVTGGRGEKEAEPRGSQGSTELPPHTGRAESTGRAGHHAPVPTLSWLMATP